MSTTYDHRILHAVEASLAEEFAGVFNLATITRFVESSYEELAENATTVMYLPVLVERFARQRLRALAYAEGLVTTGMPVVLFLCVHNAGRSQMALGFFHRYAGEQAIGWSGGSAPSSELGENSVVVMSEKGIDISDEFPKPWTDEVIRAADVVITMGCGEACPIFPGKRYEEWTLADPDECDDLDDARYVRDVIEDRVIALLDELGITPVP
jgi:protein-tyrosine-phosphatase